MSLSYLELQPATNLTTAVQNLELHFENLESHAEKEADREKDVFYTYYKECMLMAQKYSKGSRVCRIYLHTSDLLTFLSTMKEMEFEYFLDEVRKFVPQNIIEEVFGNDNDV